MYILKDSFLYFCVVAGCVLLRFSAGGRLVTCVRCHPYTVSYLVIMQAGWSRSRAIQLAVCAPRPRFRSLQFRLCHGGQLCLSQAGKRKRSDDCPRRRSALCAKDSSYAKERKANIHSALCHLRLRLSQMILRQLRNDISGCYV